MNGSKRGEPRSMCPEPASGRKRTEISRRLGEENYDIYMAAEGHIFSKFESDLPRTAPPYSGGFSFGSGGCAVDQMYSVIVDSLLPSHLQTEQIKIARNGYNNGFRIQLFTARRKKKRLWK